MSDLYRICQKTGPQNTLVGSDFIGTHRNAEIFAFWGSDEPPMVSGRGALYTTRMNFVIFHYFIILIYVMFQCASEPGFIVITVGNIAVLGCLQVLFIQDVLFDPIHAVNYNCFIF